jgi:UDP-N-acetyl-D-galactosamine dehydrogenase
VIFTSDENDLDKANFFIVAVPTPVDDQNQPDFSLVESATELIARHLKKGDTVVFESTVYPGATEEICLPILENISGLKLDVDFNLGYSPERTNPGDKEHTLSTVVKIVSGHDAEACNYIASVYEAVCDAGVHRAPTIKTAEAAKIVENTQRDVNIALMNELALIFEPMGIVTKDVIEAAGTKWNFAKYHPGLVGGHCIGVDPYYLIAKARTVGHEPSLLTAARHRNDTITDYIADKIAKKLTQANKTKGTILVLGLSFKKNVRDTRNSRIEHTLKNLASQGYNIVAYDPLLTEDEIRRGFDLESIATLDGTYDALIIATPHDEIVADAASVEKIAKQAHLVFDVQRAIPSLALIPALEYYSL